MKPLTVMNSELQSCFDRLRRCQTDEARVRFYKSMASASRRGSGAAYHMLGYMLECRLGTKPDRQSAIIRYKNALGLGINVAGYEAGRLLYEQGDFTQAHELFETAVAQGIVKAKGFLGLLYIRGHGVAQDIPRGCRLIREVIDAGDREGLRHLAEYYERYAVPPNHQAAADVLRQACQRGDARSCALLGDRYADQRLPSKHPESEALRWHLKGAELGFLDSLLWCGETLALGLNGVKKDPAQAYRWLRRAAKQQEPRAMYLIAFLMVTTRQNFDAQFDPVQLCLQAARSGEVDAQCLLGLLYRRGDYVTADRRESDHWLRLAAQAGHPRAQAELETPD